MKGFLVLTKVFAILMVIISMFYKKIYLRITYGNKPSLKLKRIHYRRLIGSPFSTVGFK